jgi:multidrug efflux system membrane fusion protein
MSAGVVKTLQASPALAGDLVNRTVLMLRMLKSPFPALAVPLLLLVACGGGSKDAARDPSKRPPQLVAAQAVSTEAYAPMLLALGTVTPRQTVAVRTRADGEIMAIGFKEGDFVRAGQMLFRLDDRQARASLAQARATLASAEALSAQASADYARAQALVDKGFVSRTILDQRKAAADAARAQIASARAQVASAQTVLSFLTITAPVSGRTGELGFRLGANVRAGDVTPLVTINQLNPIHVRFLVPAADVQAARALLAGNGGTVDVRAQGQVSGPVLANGRLVFLDNNIDPGNGGVTARAEVANADEDLWPGGLVTVALPLGRPSPRPVLPEGAVQTGRDAPFVWLVKGGKVAMRDVTVAGRLAGKVYLDKGLAPGEMVVVDALAKLKEGDKVRVKPPVMAHGGAAAAGATATGQAD